MWVPAERPLAEVWEPSADLRGERALPVLVLAGRDDAALAAAVAELAADLADATVEIGPSQRDGGRGLADVSVAMLSRGLPGFAVDRTGALHLSLARSCTGWPSAVWIDKPRRTVPDGSAFQLQHWTHTFEYALASGPGDWRSAGFVPAGQGFTAPPVAVVEPAHPGPLPPAHSLLAVDPPGAAVVTAVKPVGTPLASGHRRRRRRPRRSPSGCTRRTAGRSPRGCGWPAASVAAERADLLDRPTGPLAVGPDGAVEVPLAPCEVATVVLRPAAAAAGDEPLVPEPAGVVPARYWLENAGPAPAGNLPVSVHAVAEPGGRTGRAAGLGRLVAGRRRVDRRGHGDRAGGLGRAAGRVAGRAAAGRLGRGAGAGAARRRTRRRATTSSRSRSSTAGRPSATWSRSRVAGPVLNPGGIDVHIDTLALALRPGERGTVRIELASTYRSPLDATLELLGPVDTWPLLPQWTVPVRLDGDDRRTVELPVVVPAGVEPGDWWLLARLSGAGQVAYSADDPADGRAEP